MADVPLDILVNHIFIRLPATSLLRCRCVCKQWLGLLTDPQFISMHLKHQKIHNHQQILFRPRFYKRKEDAGEDYNYPKFKALSGVFYSVDLQSSSSSSSSADAVQLPGFHPKDYRLVRTLTCCNGLVCMEVSRRNYLKEDYCQTRHLLFGNPSTGVYKILPEAIIGPLLVGFSYDSSLDDYRFVRVDYFTRITRIFSLKSNSWRTVLGSSRNYSIKPDICHPQNIGFALDGSIYWLVETSYMIVVFDLKDEEFRELPLPRDMQREKRKNSLFMKGVADSLCVINICDNNEVTLWSMLKEEDNNNSKEKYCWIKLMTVTLPRRYFGGFFYFYPLSFMKDGKVLCWVRHHKGGEDLITGKVKFVLIDPKTKRLEDFTIHGIFGDTFRHWTFEAQCTAYIDSLVSPAGR